MTPRPHVPWLDHSRGLCSLVVCAAHTYNALVSPVTGLDSVADKWAGALSYLAVFVFFAISGYSITLSICGNVERGGGRLAAREFAADRLARLVPPLAAAVLVTAGVYLLVVGLGLNGASGYRLGGERYLLREHVAFGWKEIVAPLLFVQTILVSHGVAMNGSLWSLGFEFWFYVMAGLFTLAAVNRDRRAGFVLVLLGAGYCSTSGGRDTFAWYLPVWCFGCLTAVRLHHGRLSRRVAVRVLFVAVVVGSVAVETWEVVRYGPTVYDVYRAGVPTPLVYAASAVVVALASEAAGRLTMPVVARRASAALVWTSGYSYTLYVTHFPLLLLVLSIIHPGTHYWDAGRMVAVSVVVFLAINAFASILAVHVEDRRRFRPAFQWVLRSRATPRLSTPTGLVCLARHRFLRTKAGRVFTHAATRD